MQSLRLQSIRNLTKDHLAGKRVLVRGDLDEAVDKAGNPFRLEALLPTLKYLLENGANVVLAGHRGRPRGKVVAALSLRPVTAWLQKQLGEAVGFAGLPLSQLETSKLDSQPIALLENLRFDPREEKNDSSLACQLAKLADFYVNEAFAGSHRKHASIVGVPKYLPGYLGLQFAQEIRHLGPIWERPARPWVLILGGAKVKTKKPLANLFSKRADAILLGGKLMFVQALEGIAGVQFPIDAIQVNDIGPRTVELYGKILSKAKTIVWNGPMGRYEDKHYRNGTRQVAKMILGSQAHKIAVGGGDTLAALGALGLLKAYQAQKERIFLSTGGGAMLEFLSKGTLPGIEALKTQC